jgi:hypothetical protein
MRVIPLISIRFVNSTCTFYFQYKLLAMKTLKTIFLPIVLSALWISISEFVRNEILLKSFWLEHYQSLGLVFPSEPVKWRHLGRMVPCPGDFYLYHFQEIFSLARNIYHVVYGFCVDVARYWQYGRFALRLALGGAPIEHSGGYGSCDNYSCAGRRAASSHLNKKKRSRPLCILFYFYPSLNLSPKDFSLISVSLLFVSSGKSPFIIQS